jgi:hypothetical protein
MRSRSFYGVSFGAVLAACAAAGFGNVSGAAFDTFRVGMMSGAGAGFRWQLSRTASGAALVVSVVR